MGAELVATKERPILFSAPMVRAILEGRKTQTRRVAKPITDCFSPEFPVSPLDAIKMEGSTAVFEVQTKVDDTCWVEYLCPHGGPGDRLWVRETWQYADWTEDGEPYIRYAADGEDRLCYPTLDWADKSWDTWAKLSDPANRAIDGRSADRSWRPSIHMPRWASRITLEITGVRVERLQDINDDDAILEGMDGRYACTDPTRKANKQNVPAAVQFACLWNEINGKSHPWASNPWVWVVEFRKAD